MTTGGAEGGAVGLSFSRVGQALINDPGDPMSFPVIPLAAPCL